jgi:hypothetical protein
MVLNSTPYHMVSVDFLPNCYLKYNGVLAMIVFSEINTRQATIDCMEQLCVVRNNEKLFRGCLEECNGDNAYLLVVGIIMKKFWLGFLYSRSGR